MRRYLLWGVNSFLCTYNVRGRLQAFVDLASRIPIFTNPKCVYLTLFPIAAKGNFSWKFSPLLCCGGNMGWLTKHRWGENGGRRKSSFSSVDAFIFKFFQLGGGEVKHPAHRGLQAFNISAEPIRTAVNSPQIDCKFAIRNASSTLEHSELLPRNRISVCGKKW